MFTYLYYTTYFDLLYNLFRLDYITYLKTCVTVGVPHRNCFVYKSVSGHLALRNDVNKDCFFLGHNIGAVSENY